MRLEIWIQKVAHYRAVGNVPKLDHPIAAARDELLAVRAECYAKDAVAMALFEVFFLERFELAHEAAALRVP